MLEYKKSLPVLLQNIIKLKYKIDQAFCYVNYSIHYERKVTRVQSSVPWTINLISDERFYRVSWKNGYLDHEFFNIEDMNTDPSISSFSVFKEKGIFLNYEYLSYDVAVNIADHQSILTTADDILSSFNSSQRRVSQIDLASLTTISNGLNIVEVIAGVAARNRFESEFKKTSIIKNYSFGPAHGDFHSKNIMRKKNGEPCLIDLDCYRTVGLQSLDAIYFTIQYLADLYQTNWFSLIKDFALGDNSFFKVNNGFLGKYCSQADSKILSCIFFIDRIGQELKYSCNAYPIKVREISNTLSFLLTILES